MNLLQQALPLPGVEIVRYDGLLVDYVKAQSINVVIRSLRSPSDLEWEMSLAGMNREMTGIETLFVPAGSNVRDLSSTLVREVGQQGGPLLRFVPPQIVDVVKDRLNTQVLL